MELGIFRIMKRLKSILVRLHKRLLPTSIYSWLGGYFDDTIIEQLLSFLRLFVIP